MQGKEREKSADVGDPPPIACENSNAMGMMGHNNAFLLSIRVRPIDQLPLYHTDTCLFLNIRYLNVHVFPLQHD